jgi:putative redox protein
MCKVATVRYIARKNNWTIGEVDGEFELNVKHGEGGKLTSNVTAKNRIDGDLTARQNKCYKTNRRLLHYLHD